MNESSRRSNCPLSTALELFGDKWSLLILRDILLFSKYRYSEYLGSAEGISTNILASRLKRLESCGMIEKLADPCDGKTALYLPTALGLSLLPVMLEVIRWGVEHQADTAAPEFLINAFQQDPAELIAGCESRLCNDRLALLGAASE